MVYRAKRALFSVLGIRNYNSYYKGEGGGEGGSTPNHSSRSLSFLVLSSDDHQV